MNITTDSIEHHQPRRGLSFPEGQLAFLFLLLGIGGAVILATVQRATFSTALLFVFVAVYGLMSCRIAQTNLGDPKLKILGYFWLIKLGLTLFVLYVGWIPQLDPASSSSWGYDPQRYYLYANELVENNWSTDFVSLMYIGILYYYGAIFAIFGHNPVIPALINSFVTLMASLLLIKVGYLIKSHRGRRDWTIAWVLLLPEILWFDVITSREGIMSSLVIFTLLTMGIYFLRNTAISFTRVLIVVGLSLLGIAAIRPSMIIPTSAAICLMMFMINQQGGLSITKKITPLFILALFLLADPILSTFLGSSVNLEYALQMSTAASKNSTTELYSGSQNSIGMLLFPEGIIQSILFLPPRMVIYLVTPLPNISVSFINMWEGRWVDWQKLFCLFSSVINILVMPFVLASSIQAIKNRKENSAPLIFNISYWATFIAIAGGNLIIDERYRVMASLLLWGCAWLGWTTASKSLIKKTSILWYGFLTLGTLFYFIYKLGIL